MTLNEQLFLSNVFLSPVRRRIDHKRHHRKCIRLYPKWTMAAMLIEEAHFEFLLLKRSLRHVWPTLDSFPGDYDPALVTLSEICISIYSGSVKVTSPAGITKIPTMTLSGFYVN